MSRLIELAAALSMASYAAAQQGAPGVPRADGGRLVSAAVTDMRYDVTFTRATAADRRVRVVTTFSADGSGPVLLSLPAWTPGAYEIDNFSRWVLEFSATAGGKALQWDKVDYDTWRIRRDGPSAGPITVTFDYRADSLDNAMSWSRADFLLLTARTSSCTPKVVRSSSPRG